MNSDQAFDAWASSHQESSDTANAKLIWEAAIEWSKNTYAPISEWRPCGLEPHWQLPRSKQGFAGNREGFAKLFEYATILETQVAHLEQQKTMQQPLKRAVLYRWLIESGIQASRKTTSMHIDYKVHEVTFEQIEQLVALVLEKSTHG